MTNKAMENLQVEAVRQQQERIKLLQHGGFGEHKIVDIQIAKWPGKADWAWRVTIIDDRGGSAEWYVTEDEILSVFALE